LAYLSKYFSLKNATLIISMQKACLYVGIPLKTLLGYVRVRLGYFDGCHPAVFKHLYR